MTSMGTRLSWRRLWALCGKETRQIFRDPSSNMLVFVLPVVMLLIFGYGIDLDATKVRVGLVMEDTGAEAQLFAASVVGTPYLKVKVGHSRPDLVAALADGQVRGLIVIPPDFSQRLHEEDGVAPLQVITDGTEPNTASFVENYTRGVWQQWIAQRGRRQGENGVPAIQVETRVWFNPSALSRNYLIPGSITLIMTVVGALMTALVVAREWERGTMEALLASPITRAELIFSKLLPYYALGMVSLYICVAVGVYILGVPFRGSLWALGIVATFFLLATLGTGLLMSTTTRNQFDAAQAALNVAYLPAMMLSGFIYEIGSMPAPIRAITHLLPARYFVTAMQTLFQAGDLWGVIGPSILFLIGASIYFLGMTARKTRRRLE